MARGELRLLRLTGRAQRTPAARSRSIAAAVSSSGPRRRRSAPTLVVEACAETSTAAATVPRRSRIGAGDRAQPRLELLVDERPALRADPLELCPSASRDVTVAAVSEPSRIGSRRSASAPASSPASSTRPVEVLLAR